MSMHVLPTLATIVALLCCSAFFSSSEMAVFAVSREWVATAAATDPRAAALSDVLSNPHRLLVTVLVGNNVVNIAMSSLLTTLLVDRFDPSVAVVVTTAVASTVVLVCGEILPKSYGLGHAQSYSLRVVKPLRYVELLLYPIVAVFDTLTRTVSARIGGIQQLEQPYENDETPVGATERTGPQNK
ncbi:DUF21 domain-containing protein [Haloarcula marina]|uniref:DUF21 domain-containing protein n=1 Tax=Haloarcula marina TaxID=2961574 RepID=UPI0020B74310|nr:DUF21 domain-containing protein [Halomicroarcula marina]